MARHSPSAWNALRVHSEQLEPEKVKATPLCMAPYKYMFNSCRYPTIPSDHVEIFDPFRNHHIVAVRKNQFYVIDVVVDGQELSAAELAQ